jgi:hypothetical protein
LPDSSTSGDFPAALVVSMDFPMPGNMAAHAGVGRSVHNFGDVGRQLPQSIRDFLGRHAEAV